MKKNNFVVFWCRPRPGSCLEKKTQSILILYYNNPCIWTENSHRVSCYPRVAVLFNRRPGSYRWTLASEYWGS